MEVLFECDQCTYQEWRPEEQEPWLCPVCGNMRWGIVSAGAADASQRPQAGSVEEDS